MNKNRPFIPSSHVFMCVFTFQIIGSKIIMTDIDFPRFKQQSPILMTIFIYLEIPKKRIKFNASVRFL